MMTPSEVHDVLHVAMHLERLAQRPAWTSEEKRIGELLARHAHGAVTAARALQRLTTDSAGA